MRNYINAVDELVRLDGFML